MVKSNPQIHTIEVNVPDECASLISSCASDMDGSKILSIETFADPDHSVVAKARVTK